MKWRFSRPVWLFLAGSFSFGLAQAFNALFLNFYLRALGLGPQWEGFINALPALTLVVAGIPAASLARRISNARTLQIGAALGVVGTALLACAGSAPLAVLGALVQGVGAAFLVVSGAPFLAGHSDENSRVTLFSVQSALMTGAGFVGSLLGGQVPTWAAHLLGGSPRDLSSLRVAIIGAAAVQVLGLLPLLALRGRPEAGAAERRTLAVRDRSLMLRLILPGVLVGLGAGATIPFLNVFIEGKFHVSYASLGTLFAWTSLATALTALVQPWLVGRFGQIKTAMVVQASSLPFLALLGFAPELWMVSAALFTRGALMNASGPVYSAYAMNQLHEHDRGAYTALNTIGWDLGWALSSLASGVVRAARPFGAAFSLLFTLTLVMYSASVMAIYLGLYRRAGALEVWPGTR